MNKIRNSILIVLLLAVSFVKAEDLSRPAIWGIAKMTFLVSDFQLAKNYYGNFLGFDVAFSYSSELGKVLSFKVSNRQFIEFIEDKDAKSKKRMISYSLETENVDQMRLYLKSKGVVVPEKATVDGAGNVVFSVNDPSGNRVEFIEFLKTGLHRKSNNKFLSDNRISKRIQHVGIYAKTFADNDPFYVGILNFKELVRFPEDRTVSPTILYMGFGDSTENIEFYSPNDENVSHPCFVTDDMQETIYILKERKTAEIIGKPGIGKGNRWIMNMFNDDKTRVEFTEIHTAR